MYIPAELIKKKRNGQPLTDDEINFIISSFTSGELPDYQMSALLMAIYFNSMSPMETSALTAAVIRSGKQLSFGPQSVDKHSTGGVGDKTTLILGPIAAAAGVQVPMVAGRGLGHTGGTLDKLEAIPGFKIHLTLNQFAEQVRQHGIAMIGQTEEICPADKKMYALRDVTATIDSLPLICASIMSKKLAEGVGSLVLDVKCGRGAFMKTIQEAIKLAEALITIGKRHEKRVVAAVSTMDQVLGRFVGNSLEVEECVAILTGQPCYGLPLSEFQDTIDLSIELAGVMIWLSGIAVSPKAGLQLARQKLENGEAFKIFSEFISRQGGRLEQIPKPKFNFDIAAESDGIVSEINVEQIGLSGVLLHAGRLKSTDIIEPTAGIHCHIKVGDKVEKGQILFRLYGSGDGTEKGFLDRAQEAAMLAQASVSLSQRKVSPPRLISTRLGYTLD